MTNFAIKFIGIDPSFSGLGITIIDEEKKKIILKELSVDVGHRCIY